MALNKNEDLVQIKVIITSHDFSPDQGNQLIFSGGGK